MKLTGTGVIAVVGLAASVIAIMEFWPKIKAAAATKLNPASRDNVLYQSTGEWGTSVPDLFGGLFKSDAEKKVDAMLSTKPALSKKSVVLPGITRNVYDLGPKLPYKSQPWIGPAAPDAEYRVDSQNTIVF